MVEDDLCCGFLRIHEDGGVLLPPTQPWLFWLIGGLFIGCVSFITGVLIFIEVSSVRVGFFCQPRSVLIVSGWT